MEWQRLGELYYERRTVFEDLCWDVGSEALAGEMTAVAAFGGPLAVLEEEAFVFDERGAHSAELVGNRKAGSVWAMSGNKLADVPLEGGMALAPGGFGWLNYERGRGGELLCVVYVTGAVHAIRANGSWPQQNRRAHADANPFDEPVLSPVIFSLVPTKQKSELDSFVVYCHCFGDGMAAILRSGKLVLFFADEMRLHMLNKNRPITRTAEELDDLEVRSIAVSFDQSKQLEKTLRLNSLVVLLRLRNGPLFLVSMEEAEKKEIAIHRAGHKIETVTEGEEGGEEEVKKRVWKISAAPNGRFVAFFCEGGWLVVTNPLLENTFLEFDTKAGIPPTQMCWCGLDSIVMHWPEVGLLMVGPYGDWIKYTYNSPLLLVREIDSLRIITENRIEILSRVSSSVEAIERIGSFEPAAILCDTVEAIDAKDSNPTGIKSLKEDDNLVDAVLGVLEAAKSQFIPQKQQKLLRIAAIGKAFCDRDFDRRECASSFLLTCNMLRVLNILRSPELGLTLTFAQFEYLGPKRIVGRLVARHKHLLCLRIASYLGLEPSVKQGVLMEWAIAKLTAKLPPLDLNWVLTEASSTVTKQQLHPSKKSFTSPFPTMSTTSAWVTQSSTVTSVSSNASTSSHSSSSQDDAILRVEQERILVDLLMSRLSPCKGISYVSLSRMAVRHGKPNAAALLANFEPVFLRRTLHMLELGDLRNAMSNAVLSNDPNLLLFAVLFAWPKESSPFWAGSNLMKSSEGKNSRRIDFYKLLDDFPLVRISLLSYCRASRRHGFLKELLSLRSDFHSHARLAVIEGYEATSLEERLRKLGNAIDAYQRMQNGSFFARATQEQVRLLQIQHELEGLQSEKKFSFIDSPLMDTISQCLILRLDHKAQQIKDEFRVLDVAFAHIKVRAYAFLKEWTKLRKFAETMRANLSFLVFAEACLEERNKAEAMHYATLIGDEAEKLQAYMKAGAWENAVRAAVATKDVTSLELIRNNCNDEDLKQVILQQVKQME